MTPDLVKLRELAVKAFYDRNYSDEQISRMATGLGWEPALLRKILPWVLMEQDEVHDSLLYALETVNARVKELEEKLQNSTLTVAPPIGIDDDLQDIFNSFLSRQQGPL